MIVVLQLRKVSEQCVSVILKRFVLLWDFIFGRNDNNRIEFNVALQRCCHPHSRLRKSVMGNY